MFRYSRSRNAASDERVRTRSSSPSPPGQADQLQLSFEALEGAVAELDESIPRTTTSALGRKRREPERKLGHLPEHLPRFEQVIEPESTHCPCGCGEMVRIGEDRTERLDIVPAKLRVVVTVRPKYACRVCEQGVTQARAPAHLIEVTRRSPGVGPVRATKRQRQKAGVFTRTGVIAASGYARIRAPVRDPQDNRLPP